jgi:hypothetical protein
MATKIRCEWYDLWSEQIGFKFYRRKTRCKSEATTTFQDNPRLYPAPYLVHRYCEAHAEIPRQNAGQIELATA